MESFRQSSDRKLAEREGSKGLKVNPRTATTGYGALIYCHTTLRKINPVTKLASKN